MLKGLVDAVFAYVPVEERPDLNPGQALGIYIEGLADAACGGIAGSSVEEQARTVAAVVPHSQCGLEMAGVDHRTAVERGVDGAEAQDLSFGAAGGGAEGVLASLAQDIVAVIP